MQEPEAVKGMTDKLNQAISEGKIDDKGLKVDEITVEALTKGLAAIMPQARKEGNQWKSYMKISDIESALSDYILDQEFKNNELDGSDAVVKYPAADQWCDALLKADKERFQKAIKELLACDKNGDKKINQEELRGINTDLVFLGYDFLDLDANENGSIDFPDEAPTPKLSLESFYSPQIPETAKLLAVKPADLKRTSHYAFNAAVAGKPKYIPHKWVEKDGAIYLVGRRKNFPDDQVLLFECDLGWNGSGGLEDALKYMDKHKLEKIAVATSDDRRVVTKEELKKLKWAPKE